MSQAEAYNNVPVYTGRTEKESGGFFQPPAPTAGAGYALASVDEFRAIAEVQASMAIAKRFPRDEMAAYTRIINACKRPSLAEHSTYAYPRGGQTVTGPSIRLAEVLANSWGNVDYGYREVGSGPGYTDVEAFAFDKESNSRSCRTFRVQHKRSAKGRLVDLTDPRDVYELVANQASRRIRACILQIIPGDVTEEALKACETTIKKSGGNVPLADRVRKMAVAFQEMGVKTEMLEARLGHKLDATIEQELIQLRRIYTSINDGAAKREDFFDFTTSAPVAQADKAQATKGNPGKPAAPAPAPAAKPAAKNEKPAPAAPPKQEQPKTESRAAQPGTLLHDQDFAPHDDNQELDSSGFSVTCPSSGYKVDELECLNKKCRNGCPVFE
jgi:hypothetical protein